MSDVSGSGYSDNLSTFSKLRNQILSAIDQDLNAGNASVVTAILSIVTAIETVFPRITGTFTLAAAATTTVTEPGTHANSVIDFVPTNAAAATLMSGSKSLYRSTRTAGVSFVVATGDATAAAGTETFDYYIINPS